MIARGIWQDEHLCLVLTRAVAGVKACLELTLRARGREKQRQQV